MGGRLKRRKANAYDGTEGGELIDLLSVFASEDQWQTEALVFII